MPASGGEGRILLRLQADEDLLDGLERQEERAGIFALLDAVDGPQAEHQVFPRALAQRHELRLRQNDALFHDALDVFFQIRLDGEPAAGKIGRRARAEAQIFVADPVFHIVAADEAVVREVGDLILVIAELLERFDGVEVHIGLRVVVGEVRAILVGPELRAGLDLEAVAADVVGLEVDDVAQGLHPLLARLVRQPVHEVDRDIVKARAARERDGLLRLPVVVRAAEGLELGVVVRLHADGDAVEARAAQPHEHGQRHGVGVGLKRDLRVAADVEAAVDLGEDLRKSAGAEERGRAAAKIDGIDLIAGRALRRLTDVEDDGIEIPVHQIPAARAGDGIGNRICETN